LEAQQFPPDAFEVFVMDNLSTDDTEVMVREHAARVPFAVHYRRMERDGGPVPARNLAAELAQGEILAFTDSDCRPCPDWLALGVAAFTDNVALVSGPVIYKPEQQGNFFSRRTGESKVEHPSYPCANVMYRRQVFLDHGGFNASLCFVDPFDRAVECADTDLAWRILGDGYRNVFLEDMIVYHELESQTPMTWLLEPTRVFCVPELIRRHPNLRSKLLYRGLFFYRGSIFYYLALVIAVAVAALDARLLLLAPVLLIVRALMRAPRLSPVAWARSFMEVCMNVARNYLLIVTLVYGSIRFRTPVL
jgi:glycosyltransferase involved in cell wall biosynthesis